MGKRSILVCIGASGMSAHLLELGSFVVIRSCTVRRVFFNRKQNRTYMHTLYRFLEVLVSTETERIALRSAVYRDVQTMHA
jgi:hypothetical protein